MFVLRCRRKVPQLVLKGVLVLELPSALTAELSGGVLEQTFEVLKGVPELAVTALHGTLMNDTTTAIQCRDST